MQDVEEEPEFIIPCMAVRRMLWFESSRRRRCCNPVSLIDKLYSFVIAGLSHFRRIRIYPFSRVSSKKCRRQSDGRMAGKLLQLESTEIKARENKTESKIFYKLLCVSAVS
eukprot:gb/GECG01014350.1/.p1 GENE.gb/GECG01014350.1/~~gb/GECG01014350.1/.p1  ORF type:complete len:111 (+),score=6.96 gb/GECG01014350.1/:1-333(+)